MENFQLTRNTLRNIILGVCAFFVLCTFPKLAENVNNNKIVISQSPIAGDMTFWTTPGLKWQGWGTITEYYKTNQVWFNVLNETKEGNLVPASENGAFPITYSDKGKGFILGSVRIELPLSESKLNLIQQHYGSEHRLIEELIKPTIGKVILACGPLMTSLESVSEKRNDLIYYATDQLNAGIYETRAKTVEKLNAITGEVEKIQQAYVVVDSLGHPKRQEESPFDKYGLRVSQLSIADLKYESATNDQISKQRNADLEIITAKAEAAKAIQNTVKVEEEGKQASAKAKWEQEVIKATAVTKAQQEYEVAALEAKRAKEVAEKVIQEGRAEAEANRAKVAAGLTPQEAAEWRYKTQVGVAEAFAKWQGPKIISMGNNGGGSMAMEAFGLKQMMDIADKVSTK